MIDVTVPMPPSERNLYRGGRTGPRRSELYRLWLEVAGVVLRRQRPGPIWGDVEVEYVFGPRRGKAELWQQDRPISVLLVRHRLIENRRRIVRATLAWGEGAGCRVKVRPAMG